MDKLHTVKSFDEDLRLLTNKILEMGDACREQLIKAVKCMTQADQALSQEVIKGDAQVNGLQDQTDQQTVKVLATRQPVAMDLRRVIASLKIATDLERVADYSVTIARQSLDLDRLRFPESMQRLEAMGAIALDMLDLALAAYQDHDLDKARDVWSMDDQVDSKYAGIFTAMRQENQKDPDAFESSQKLLLIARSLERVADHITNVCGHVTFVITGQRPCRQEESC